MSQESEASLPLELGHLSDFYSWTPRFQELEFLKPLSRDVLIVATLINAVNEKIPEPGNYCHTPVFSCYAPCDFGVILHQSTPGHVSLSSWVIRHAF
jgi:hypothetical protein